MDSNVSEKFALLISKLGVFQKWLWYQDYKNHEEARAVHEPNNSGSNPARVQKIIQSPTNPKINLGLKKSNRLIVSFLRITLVTCD